MDFEQNIVQLKKNRNKLNKYVKQINQKFGSTSKTIQEILWAAIKSDEDCGEGKKILKNIYLKDCENISNIQIDDACAQLDMLKIILAMFLFIY